MGKLEYGDVHDGDDGDDANKSCDDGGDHLQLTHLRSRRAEQSPTRGLCCSSELRRIFGHNWGGIVHTVGVEHILANLVTNYSFRQKVDSDNFIDNE